MNITPDGTSISTEAVHFGDIHARLYDQALLIYMIRPVYKIKVPLGSIP